MSGSNAPAWKDLDHGGYQRRHWLRRKVGKALVKHAIKSITNTGRIWTTAAAGQKLGQAFSIYNTPSKDSMAKRMKYAPKTRRRRGAQVAKKKSKGRVARDGVKRVKHKTHASRHKVKSLKKRVVALEGKQPLKSKLWRIEHQYYCMKEEAHSACTWYSIPLAEKATTQTFTQVLVGSDAGTSCKVSNVRTEYSMRNNSTSNVNLEYQIMRCTGNTSGSILNDLRGAIMKKGVLITPTVTNAVGHTTTASEIPEFLKLTGTETRAPIWNVNRDSTDWKPVGNIEKATIGPGDVLSIKHNTGKFTFDVDNVAEADSGTVFWRNLDYVLVIRVFGALGHDSGSNQTNVGTGGWQLDCIWDQSMRAAHVNGQGTDQIQYVTVDNGQNITDIEFADNHVSAIGIMED